MRSLPLRTRAIIIVRVHIVIVHVHPREQAGPGRAAHGRGDVSVPECRSLVPHGPQRLGHEVERAQLDILVIGEDEHDVRLALPRRGDGGQNGGAAVFCAGRVGYGQDEDGGEDHDGGGERPHLGR